MTLRTVASGLKVRLATISGLRVYDYLPDSITVPAAVVGLPVLTDSWAAGLGPDLAITLHVLVARANDRTAIDALFPYLDRTGTKSVRAALEGDLTLAGACRMLRVVGATPATVTVAGSEYLSAAIDVEVWT